MVKGLPVMVNPGQEAQAKKGEQPYPSSGFWWFAPPSAVIESWQSSTPQQGVNAVSATTIVSIKARSCFMP